MDEDLELPGSAPEPEKLICFRLEPRLTERRVMGSKLVFRGSADLHVLYRSREGRLCGWDFSLPFSQFAELDRDYGPDAQADIQPGCTSLELEMEEGGRFRFKGGVLCQYLITDKQLLELVEDAYCPGRALELQRELLEVPVILESRRETVSAAQTLPGDAEAVADVVFQPDFPRQRTGDRGVELELPGVFQTLCWGPDGKLFARSARWEGRHTLMADPDARLQVLPGMGETTTAAMGSGQVSVSTDLPLEVTVSARQRISMVTGLTLGQLQPKEPGRPSLILRRSGEDRLWDIAKASGATVDSIRRLNGLTEEPAPDRMLLVPVP